MKYVYFIKNKTTGFKYIGSKTSKTANPKMFWIDYFTSSKLIKELILIYGKQDFEFKILKTFSTKYDTLLFEKRLLDLAVKKVDYLNIHKGFLPKTEQEYLDMEINMYKVRSFYGKIQAIRKTGFHSKSEEERKLDCSIGGLTAAKINKELNRAIFNQEVRKKQHETLKRNQVSAYYDPKLKKEISASGGRKGAFSKNYYEKLGLSEEDRIKAQSDRGKIGGKKNKGFIWYTDGEKSYKYTSEQQKLKSFTQFLEENKNYKKGRKI